MRPKKKLSLYSAHWISAYSQQVIDRTTKLYETGHPFTSLTQTETLFSWSFQLFTLRLIAVKMRVRALEMDLAFLNTEQSSIVWARHLLKVVSQWSRHLYNGEAGFGAQPHTFWQPSIQDSPDLGLSDTVSQAMKSLWDSMTIFQEEPIDFSTMPIEVLGALHEQGLQWIVVEGHIRPRDQRKKAGVHFTPLWLARQLVREAFEVYIENREQPMTDEDWLSLTICDPAMGGGAFLLAVCREIILRLDTVEEHTVQRIVENVLHGVDIHPRAVQITMLSLWVEVGTLSLSTTHWHQNFQVGNSLLGYLPHELGVDVAGLTEAQLINIAHCRWNYFQQTRIGKWTSKRQEKHWHAYEQEIQTRLISGEWTMHSGGFHWNAQYPSIWESGGFDVMVGNPPFVNAIRGHVSSMEKVFYQHRFTTIRGAADLAYYFLELSTHLIQPIGVVSFILPKVSLGASSLSTFRERVCPRRIHLPSEMSLFADANVQVVLLTVSTEASCLITAQTYPTPEDWILIQHHHQIHWTGLANNWWTLFWCASQQRSVPNLADCVSLSQTSFEVASGLITSEFYEVDVVDSAKGTGLQLLTSGGIDANQHFWGVSKQRFRKKKYLYPRLDETNASSSLLRKFKRSRRPKIILANQTATVEGFLDRQGAFQASTATSELYHQEDSVVALEQLLAWLHSVEFDVLYNACLGYNALGEGISMSKAFLEIMPIPRSVLLVDASEK